MPRLTVKMEEEARADLKRMEADTRRTAQDIALGSILDAIEAHVRGNRTEKSAPLSNDKENKNTSTKVQDLDRLRSLLRGRIQWKPLSILLDIIEYGDKGITEAIQNNLREFHRLVEVLRVGRDSGNAAAKDPIRLASELEARAHRTLKDAQASGEHQKRPRRTRKPASGEGEALG